MYNAMKNQGAEGDLKYELCHSVPRYPFRLCGKHNHEKPSQRQRLVSNHAPRTFHKMKRNQYLLCECQDVENAVQQFQPWSETSSG